MSRLAIGCRSRHVRPKRSSARRLNVPSPASSWLQSLLHRLTRGIGPLERRAGRRLLQYVAPYKGRVILGTAFGVVYGAVNGMVPLAINAVMETIFGGQASQAQLAEAVKTGTGPALTAVLWVCLFIPLLMAVRALLTYGNAYFMAWVSLRMLCDLRLDLFRAMLGQSLGFFHRQRAGELIARVSSETRMIQFALTTVSTDLVKQPVSILTGVAVLLYFDWVFTLCTLVVFPVCLAPMLIYGKRIRKSGREEEHDMSNMMVVLQECFAGIRVIKSFAREDRELQRFDEANRAQFGNSMRVRRATDIVSPLVEVVAAIGVAFALLYVAWRGLPAATFLALLSGIFLLYEPIKHISRLHLTVQKCLSATVNILDLLDLRPEVPDPPDPLPFREVRGDVRFENISFAYASGQSALARISLAIPAGTTAALVGESGAGKSTLFSLLLRFYDPQAGAITIDDLPIQRLRLTDLRHQIAYVTQETFLFHESIRENIRYGRLDATDAEVEEAARLAFAHDFILASPGGYDTVIGDKGAMLSGGQQQRLAIARAFLKNAPILLLDEATSALDSQSEKQIQRAIEQLSAGRTVLVIAHRLSTVLHADTIYVLKNGRLAASGPHHELLAHSPEYQGLYHLQFAGGTSAPAP